MRKCIVSKLILLVVILSMTLVACTSGTNSINNDDNIIIGISQLSDHPALDDARQGFEDGLKELNIDAEIVYQNAQGDVPTSLSISQKFVEDKVDLIYAIATPAAQSAKQSTDEIPILFSAVTDPVAAEIVDDWDNVGGNVTGTSDMAPTSSQLKMFKKIDPDIGTIGILYNTDESNSEVQIEEVKKLAPEEELKVVTKGVNNVNDIPQSLDSLLSKVDALYIVSDNLIASSIELVSNKLIEKNMISISAEESQVGGGILLTNGLSYYELGKQTAEMAKRILVDEENISNLPVEKAEETLIKVNEKTLKELNLDTDLPIFKDATKISE
ncbi:MAG TPA: ABC transporter substrate-binding protein [Tissierellaceae bacterium]|nr:ABC transporter substrate-binding protein [Tissierellaceae bacterium]